MIEDENMRIANRITVLRAKKEYQMIKQARQQQQPCKTELTINTHNTILSETLIKSDFKKS